MSVILITGATRGIGASIAEALDAPGAELLLTGTKPHEVERLNHEAPPNRRYLHADFADSSSLEAFTHTIGRMTRIDVLVNNAGINIIKPVGQVSHADYDHINAINAKAPYFIAKTVAGVMKRHGGGRIVNIASIWSRISKPSRSLYSGSKTWLTGMTRALAAELAPDNILVNCVSPGFTLTDLTSESLSEKEIQEISQQIPQKRMASPDEIARLVRFLSSEENTYITGQNIVIDGGFSIV